MEYTDSVKIPLRKEMRFMEPGGIFILAIAAVMVVAIIVSNASRKKEKKDEENKK